ncbi:ADP-ribosylation factor GTPase-activating protein 3-like [Cyprinus carpio]|uniref:ADP-ribosylation factor GTPase-activating protein 3-like n=1 Tax=Cyprinus carpio TaxID=7962 RepID=A0A9R0AVC1_CYPCA|nr:ADP-ribosylation factor GTPase-activating protein 3-like [Cyprinus carpio]
MDADERVSARRKEPQPVSDDAQRKFANAKAISSDMFFGKQDNAEYEVLERGWRISRAVQRSAQPICSTSRRRQQVCD